jgi:hypothetical protein
MAVPCFENPSPEVFEHLIVQYLSLRNDGLYLSCASFLRLCEARKIADVQAEWT